MKGFADESAGLHDYVKSMVEKRLQQPVLEQKEDSAVPTLVD
jgi:hypothetical protein